MKINDKMKKVLSFALFGADLVPALAQSIDRMLEKRAEKRRALTEEAAFAIAEIEEEAVELVGEVEDVDDASDDDDGVALAEADGDAEKGRFGRTTGLVFFDAKANPEKYAELLARESRGEVTVVTRYRHSFVSRVAQADGEVQEYYSVLKNKLLSYKGVKSRASWSSESFNKGRGYVAKINVKAKTIYLYLAMDPAYVSSVEDGKYRISDMSEKKKHANVPVLFKIKGPRKLKYALELIELLCEKQMELPPLKNFEETDYVPQVTGIDALVESGDVKMMVCGVENAEG